MHQTKMTNNLKVLILLLILLVRLTCVFGENGPEILFLISSQPSECHHPLSVALRKDIMEQARSLAADSIINVQILHEILKFPGGWTVLFGLRELHAAGYLGNLNTKWIILCEETTRVNLRKLLQVLSNENADKPAYFGYPLRDREATIIHHFAFFENPKWFTYPLLRAGVIFSSTLLTRMALLLGPQRPRVPRRVPDFSIDAAHELALFIMINIQQKRAVYEGGEGLADASGSGDSDTSVTTDKELWHINENHFGRYSHRDVAQKSAKANWKMFRHEKVLLKRPAYICSADATMSAKYIAENCALYPSPMVQGTCARLKQRHIYFAIKTCQQFHGSRIPVLESTWAPLVTHKTYFSDVTEEDIPTVNTGVPNVVSGHCTKSLAILKLALQDIRQRNRHLDEAIRWLVLSDDDTLFSIGALSELLGCFNHTQPTYLGERYGYGLNSPNGFDYITGGGGIVLSLPAIELILEHCSCPSVNSPDDMILGSCLKAQQVVPIHSSRFHQARPVDYAPEVLQFEVAISFHKFWQIDPIEVYDKWLRISNREMHTESTTAPDAQQLNDRACCLKDNLTIAECQCLYLKGQHHDLR